ncbi:DUF4007 family protein [uncultured Psychroserpens sp.]|uniref:DUF4007 family protein n=1 Tax=uncultured Psychroserpens sp. TaxID=255436 RepID=UPI00262BAFAD|nr:DUF4007 family protein [uncultured Psychroserpens sp.]
MSVYFHANFNLDRKRLSGILKLIIENKNLCDDDIAKKFGYKSPFTKRYISWLKKCGILENSSKRKLTNYGEVIYKKDPLLNKKTTLWFMHTELTKNEENAEAWHFFFHNFLNKHNSFTKKDLQLALSMKMMPHDPHHFSKNAPMIKVITRVLIDSYISETAFSPLNIIKLKGSVFFRSVTKPFNKWNNIEEFIQLY